MRVLMAATLLVCGNQLGRSKASPSISSVTAMHQDGDQPLAVAEEIWVVEQTSQQTRYSNGLSVRRDHETASVARNYHVYQRDTLQRSPVALTAPIGIVFHTTESLILPLQQAQNGALLQTSEGVLDHARNGRLYNFVVDRFGQVSSIVPEGQTALHAGHSIWASGSSVWIDLNESFLGISFEAESTAPFEPSAAQIHSGRLLTGMLRSRFSIPEANCVTHGQVSVNPDNMRIGYHTDWGGTFPFRKFGLRDGYNLPVAAVAIFGFEHDETFLHANGNQLWPGLVAADRLIDFQAAQLGLTAQEFSTRLQQRYTNLRRHRHE